MFIIFPKQKSTELSVRKALRYCTLTSLLFVSSVHAEIIWVGVKDPNIKDALFESYQGRHFDAITRLSMAQKLGRVVDQEQAGLVLGGLYLAYGFHDHAAKIFETFLGDEQPKEVRDQAWYFLAKTRYQRGNYAGAMQALNKVQDTLDFGLTQERNLLEATILLKPNRAGILPHGLITVAKIFALNDKELAQRVKDYQIGKKRDVRKI